MRGSFATVEIFVFCGFRFLNQFDIMSETHFSCDELPSLVLFQDPFFNLPCIGPEPTSVQTPCQRVRGSPGTGLQLLLLSPFGYCRSVRLTVSE